jgi:sulfatase modifying factor 1
MTPFDPYHIWLGIPPEDQPPSHYRLLAIPELESNPDVIDTAAERQTVFLRTFQAGDQAQLAEQLLNEVSAARVCLLSAEQKAEYDQQLQAAIQPALVPIPALVQNDPLGIGDEQPTPAVPLPSRRTQSTQPIRQQPRMLAAAGGVVVVALVLLVLSSGRDKPDLIVNSIGMKLALIPAGEFQMGSPDSEPDHGDDEAQHLVKITSPFYLAVHEVTQQQYEKVIGARPWEDRPDVKMGDDYPAVYVSWNDAVQFCHKLSEKEGVKYHLPTEAEWEYACRAGTTTAYSFGDDASTLGEYAWHEKNTMDIGEKYAHLVGQKLPNHWGLYDMHGNVWEWCLDWSGPYGNEEMVSDPAGPSRGNRKVLRGGSFNAEPPPYLRSAKRSNILLPGRFAPIGFRVARSYDVTP